MVDPPIPLNNHVLGYITSSVRPIHQTCQILDALISMQMHVFTPLKKKGTLLDSLVYR